MLTTIDKKQLRKELLGASISKQQFLIDDFKERIKSLTESEGLGNEESYDNSDQASNTVKASELNTLNEALEFANKELSILEKLKTTLNLERNVVALGAIVVTNRNTLFISASVEKFVVQGHTYVGISTSSPIYKTMRGMKKGETFTYHGTSYKIKDIF